MRGRNARTFCFRKTSFVHPRSGTYYALLLRYFSLKFLPDVPHRAYWVLDEIWAPDSSHKIGNNFLYSSLPGHIGRFVCVWNCFDFFRGRILICLTWNLSRFVPKSMEILMWNFRKKYFGRIFQKFCANQGYPLPKLVKFRPIFWNFIMGSVLRWKNSNKYFHILFAPL